MSHIFGYDSSQMLWFLTTFCTISLALFPCFLTFLLPNIMNTINMNTTLDVGLLLVQMLLVSTDDTVLLGYKYKYRFYYNCTACFSQQRGHLKI